MPSMPKYLLPLLLSLMMTPAHGADLTVGVLANWGYQAAQERWQPLMRYLESEIPGTQFSVYPGTFEQLNQALESGKIQFIVTNPGQYLYLSNQYPLSWLATMRSRQHHGTTYAIGSAILVRADSPYRTLYDLQNRTVAASGPHALGGYQAAVGLMRQLGMRPETFFKQVNFLGFPLDPLVYQVRDRQVDAAITPFCTLEEMVKRGLVNPEDYRVLNPSRPPGYDCQVSTALYPNWSFAASESVEIRITKAITQALMDLTPEHPAAVQGQFWGWTSPISQLKVIQLFSELQGKPERVTYWQHFQNWLKENRHWGMLALVMFLAATFYHFWLEYKFRQKSETLVKTERALKQKALQMERLQSAAIVGEIGAGLAHEINQPIAAITNYSEGGMMRLQSQTKPDTELLALLDKIHQQSSRAGAIVHRIRGLLKRREAVFGKTNLLTLVDESLALLRSESERHGIPIRSRVTGEPYVVEADAVGMQQVMVNLLKNSLDALKAHPPEQPPTIWITLHFEPNQVTLQVMDNGPGLSHPAEQLMATFITTKPDGLGLGLAICTDIAKAHDGEFQIENHPEGGCQATLFLPRQTR